MLNLLQDNRGLMRAMLLDTPGGPLRETILPIPWPAADEVLIRVRACGVCRTDLHIVDGDLAPHLWPVIPGHEIVGEVVHVGEWAHQFSVGERVGVPWLGSACGHCRYCASHRENLCDQPAFTGYDRHGGYAQYAVARANYCLRLPDGYDDLHLAPMLCAGLIGYRAWKMAGDAKRLGLYGFGAAAHLLVQLAVAQGQQVYAFTRPGDERSQAFARELGASWAGPAGEAPAELDAAILFAPAGELVPIALRAVAKGGVVVCAGIHMSDIPAFPYALLWGERRLCSVANLTREDGRSFMCLLARHRIKSRPRAFPLAQANQALAALRSGDIDGAAVLVP
ncbi:MAG: zinc-dependent alcohol dehydrogenase family protein [Paucimonas sp.]|nr:zinc-dependent alcohol dehydrogenase family protein [Paucimonas sp.]